MIGAVTSGLDSTQASATCAMEMPRALAIFSTTSTISQSAFA